MGGTMNLPEGFVLDEPDNKKSTLPQGFLLDEPEQKGLVSRAGSAIKNAWQGNAEFKNAGNAADYIDHLAANGFYDNMGFFGKSPLEHKNGLDLSGTFGNNDDIINRIKDINPNAVIKTDVNGNQYVEENGMQFYGNKPGGDFQDAGELIGEGAAYAVGGAAGSLAKGFGTLARMVATGLAEGGINMTGQKLAGRDDINKTEAATATLAGGLFEGLAPAVSAVWRKVKNTGVSDVQAGKALAKELGATVDDAQAKRLGNMVKNYDPNQVSKETMLEHVELGQKPTLGTLTKNQRILDREDFLRNSGRDKTIGAFKRLDDQNDEALEALAAQRSPDFDDRFQAASAVQESLTNKSNAMNQASSEAWDSIPNATASTSIIKDAPQRISQRFETATRYIDEDITPAAFKATQKIKEFSEKLGDDVDWNRINLERKRIGGLFDAAKSKEDKAALSIVKDEFQKTYKEAFEKQLLSGDPNVMKKLDKAVQASSDYFSMFDGKDPTGKMVKGWLDQNIPPEQIADAFFTRQNGAIKAKAPQVAAKLKEILGKDSQGFENVRQMAVQGVMGGKNRATLRTALKNALNNNPSFMNEMFTKKELNFMSRTLSFLDDTALKGKAGRSSGTTERAFRWITEASRGDNTLSNVMDMLKGGLSRLTGAESRYLKAPTAQLAVNPVTGAGTQGVVNYSNQ